MVSSFRSIYRFLNPWILPQTKRLLCPTSPSTLRVATSPSRGGLGSPESFASSPEAPLLGELSAKQTERLEGRNSFPFCSICRFLSPKHLPQTKRLLCPTSPSTLRVATSPSRGGFGREGNLQPFLNRIMDLLTDSIKVPVHQIVWES